MTFLSEVWQFSIEFLRSPWAHLLTFVIGLAFGHHLSADKEKKKERNQAAEKFTVLLINDKRRIRNNIRPDLTIQNVQADNFRTFLSWRERRAFDRDWKIYKDTESQEFGKKFIGNRPYYNNRAKVILKLGDVLKHTKPV